MVTSISSVPSGNVQDEARGAKVQRLLEETYQENEKLFDDITSDMLSALAEALEPYVARYETKYDVFPNKAILMTIVKNFNMDGPLVQILLNINTAESHALWDKLRLSFLKKTQRDWSNIDSHYQEDIVSHTMIRIQRYLPNFLFLSKFSSWAYTIWQNEGRRLAKKIKEQQESETSLDRSIYPNREANEGSTLGEKLPGIGLTPSEITEQNQLINNFWQRLSTLDSELNIQMLRLHLAGHTLKEIKQALGDNSLTISTIKRRLDRVKKKIKNDDMIKQIAQQLGFSLGEGESDAKI